MTLVYYQHEEVYCSSCAPPTAQACYSPETPEPVHCDSCEDLLMTILTEEGEKYVRETIKEGNHKPNILDMWKRRWYWLDPDNPDYEE